jgi:(+)-neomenthol dehydrogenase
MAELTIPQTKRYVAVVTGGNKGVGFEICRKLALNEDIMVVLTARDENRGLQAVDKLKDEYDLENDRLIFHQLDVCDSASVESLVDFIQTKFGKLDILVNNAASTGCELKPDVMKRAVELCGGNWPDGKEVSWDEIVGTETLEMAEEGLRVNYYGTKRMTEAFLHLLHFSHSPRILNVTSTLGMLMVFPGEEIRKVLNDMENLTEERIDELLNEYLNDFKEGLMVSKGWPENLSGYKLSKAAINAYTRIMAKRNPNVAINCICPGYVKTDMTCNSGGITPSEAAHALVKVVTAESGGPSGYFFRGDKVSPF